MSKDVSIKGTIKLIEETQTFKSGFEKRVFVVTTNEQYPQDIAFELYKDKCTTIQRFKPGQEVEVFYNLRGSEYNGKYYVSLNAWMIKDTREEAGHEKVQPVEEETDLPF